MRIYESLEEIPACERGSAVAFGVFDGVHIGHVKIITRCVSEARDRSLRSVIITFRRHPREILKRNPPDFLMTVEHRLEHLAALGVEECLLLDFNKRLAATPPLEFLEKFVVRPFKAAAVVVGWEQRFGNLGRGDAALVKAAAARFGYEAVEIEPVEYAGAAVSSSRIRQCIADGDMEAAAKMLGRQYVIEGLISSCEVSRIGTFVTVDARHEARPREGRFEAVLETPDEDITVGAHMPPEGNDIEIFIPEAAHKLPLGEKVRLCLHRRL